MDTVLENNSQTFPRSPEQLRSVHTITDRFSQTNSYLIEDGEHGESRGIIIVDPGYELHVRLTLHYLQHILHHSPADIDLIVLTSLRSEYLSGLAVLHMACPGAMVAASEVARPSAGEIDTWLKDVAGLPAHPNWRVIAYPAHTPESICLYNPFSKELLCGDTLRTVLGNRFLRRTGTYRYASQQTHTVLQSLDICYLYPLHGRPVLSSNPFKHIAEHWSDE